MEDNGKSSVSVSPEAATARRLEAMNLQAIEGNALDADDVAMFYMFDREGWSAEERIAYIRAHADGAIATAAE